MERERYPGQAKDEITQFVIFKHWASVAPVLLVGFLILGLSIYAISYGASATGNLFHGFPKSSLSVVGVAGVAVAMAFFIAVIWIWRHNRIIVTNEHLVDIDQIGLFNRKLAIVNLGSIQDLSTQVNGPMQTLLKYGRILVQTAGESQNFSLDYMPDPYHNEQLIHEAHRNYIVTHEQAQIQTKALAEAEAEAVVRKRELANAPDVSESAPPPEPPPSKDDVNPLEQQ